MIHSINQSSKKKQNQIWTQAIQNTAPFTGLWGSMSHLDARWETICFQRKPAPSFFKLPLVTGGWQLLLVGSFFIGLLYMVTIYYYAQLYTPIFFYLIPKECYHYVLLTCYILFLLRQLWSIVPANGPESTNYYKTSRLRIHIKSWQNCIWWRLASCYLKLKLK